MKAEILTACDQTVAATVNGVYQGVLLTLVVALGMRWLGRTNAATRHTLWMATLLLLPGILAAHYCLDQPGHPPAAPEASLVPSTVITEAVVGLPESISSGATGSKLTTEKHPAGQGDASPAAGDEIVQASQLDEHTPASPPVPWDPVTNPAKVSPALKSRAVAVPAATVLSKPVPITAPSFSWMKFQADLLKVMRRLAQPVYWNAAAGLSVPRIAGLMVLGVWLAVAGAKLLLLAWRLGELRKLKQASSPAAEPLIRLFQDLRRRMGLKRDASLRVSAIHRSPVVIGFFHPVVLLPPGEFLPVDLHETEQILRHELAHVRRGDDWANLVQHFFQASLFFHPGVWWVARQLALEREIACDDLVLREGGKPKTYALLLANLASRIKRCPPMLAPGVSTNKSQLQKRINMILDTNRNISPVLSKTRTGFITSAAALFAVLAIYSGPRFVLAQTALAGSADRPATAEATERAPAAVISPSPSLAEGGSVSVAQDESPNAPSSADSGPRYKPEVPGNSAPPQAIIISPPHAPTPPVAVVPAAPAATPLILTAPRPGALPALAPTAGIAYASADGGRDGGSLERRLDHLEQLVHSLMAQQNGMHPFPGQSMPKHPGWNGNIDEKQMADLKQMAEREGNRAQQEAKRAAEDAKRASKDMERAMKEKGERMHGDQKEGGQRQLEALRRAREGLERQMERLDSQIEKLEQDQEKLQDEKQRRSELQEDQAKEERAVAETTPAPEPR